MLEMALSCALDHIIWWSLQTTNGIQGEKSYLLQVSILFSFSFVAFATSEMKWRQCGMRRATGTDHALESVRFRDFIGELSIKRQTIKHLMNFFCILYNENTFLQCVNSRLHCAYCVTTTIVLIWWWMLTSMYSVRLYTWSDELKENLSIDDMKDVQKQKPEKWIQANQLILLGRFIRFVGEGEAFTSHHHVCVLCCGN